MTLLSGRMDEPRRTRPREITRNCGPLLGRLDELLPRLYVAQYGASLRDLREWVTQTAPGLFAVGERTG